MADLLTVAPYPAPAVYSDAKTDDWLLQRIRDVTDPNVLSTERLAQEEADLRNLAYYFGKQHFLQVGAMLREPVAAPKHRVFSKSNFIIGEVNRAVAKILKAPNTAFVIPEGTDRKQLHAAKISERVLQHHIFNVTRYNTKGGKKYRALLWAANTGSCWLKTVWDPMAGRPQRWYLNSKGEPEPAISDQDRIDRENKGQYDDVPVGEVSLGIVNAFQFYCDMDEREDMLQADWCATTQWMSRNKVVQIFGEQYKDVKSGSERWQNFYFQEALAFMQTGFRHGDGIASRRRSREEDVVRVAEYWQVPSRIAPQGVHGIIIGNVVAKNDPHPYRWATGDAERGLLLPFAKVDWWTMPGRFKAISLTEQLISPQFQYNKARSTIIELQNVFGHPATYIDKGSGLPAGNQVIDPGAVWEINAGSRAPQHGPTPELSPEVTRNAQWCKEDLMAISASSAPDMSKLPGQIRSGDGLQYMLEEKSIVLSPTAEMAADVDERVGRNLLSLARHYYNEQRVLRYIGNDEDLVVEYFTGADLSNDLHVTSDPDATFSSVAARGRIMDMIQVGALNPQQDPEDKAIVLEAMNFHTADNAMKRKLRGQTRQQKELQRMIENAQQYIQAGGYPVQQWEPHADHISVIVDFLQTDEAEELPPQTLALIETHLQKHEQFQQQQQQAQMQMMAMMKGVPGQKGQPSAPAPAQ